MRTIEFETKPAAPAATLWQSTGSSSFANLILKPEYSTRLLRIPVGTTWLRVLPAVKGSRGWMHGIHVLQHPGGQHARAKGTVFDVAYTWLRKHQPELLFSGANKDGYRLLADRMTACWVLLEENEKLVARILLGNGYDGSRGGTIGLGHQLLQRIDERDEKLGIVLDPLDPITGVQVSVEKSKPAGAKYPSYKLRLGQQPAPIQRYLDRMEQSEIDAICPIEETIRTIEPELEWELLAKVIGPELRDEIRAATAPRQAAAHAPSPR